MTPALFEALLQELIDENPFAIRAALRILKVEYTTEIATLAVTCEEQPRMLVNLAFLGQHAKTETQAKAVVVHEFLHVLLRHTEGRQPLTPARHLAFDAVINAIIHRQYGEAYSSMMATYYANCTGLQKLLRPMNGVELQWLNAHGANVPQWAWAWSGLYSGRLIADDIESLAHTFGHEALTPSKPESCGPFTLVPGGSDYSDLLGNHDDLGRALDGDLARAVESALKQMNGAGIWRSPRERGIGGPMVDALFPAGKAPVRAWEARTLALIRRHITPDRHSRSRREELWSYRIPVLSPADRRAFLKAQWSPFLPESAWEGPRLTRDGTAQVYLDVSGSMNTEMPMVIALLNRLGRHIRRPFWAFSDRVAPAVIERGQLRTSTTGGTSMQCVLEHVAKTRPDAAIVVTDGFIEAISRSQVTKTQGTRLHVLVTRSGNPGLIAKTGLPYTQLEGSRMIHCAEAVLPGHPDKFCDRVADAIVALALAADPAAFAQIEVGVWADQAWLSGTIVTRKPLAHTPSEILVQAGLSIGLDAANHIDATRYRVTDAVCQNIDDPTESRAICDDQCIVIGYAGYDRKTRYLPPEHFLVHSLVDGLWSACRAGSLKGCGPDGKVLVTMREEANVWALETVLVTLQHPTGLGLMDLTQRVHECLRACYSALQASDARWTQDWCAVEVLVNPNGPHLRGGSDGDNGQTGRKLVMDYYGPRIPLGGGALAGKHPAHIDRLASRAARQAAVHAVQTGAPECTIRLAYAPNRNAPLQETWEMGRRGERQSTGFFNFDAMLARLPTGLAARDQGNGVYTWELPGEVESVPKHPGSRHLSRNHRTASTNERLGSSLDHITRSTKGRAA